MREIFRTDGGVTFFGEIATSTSSRRTSPFARRTTTAPRLHPAHFNGPFWPPKTSSRELLRPRLYLAAPSPLLPPTNRVLIISTFTVGARTRTRARTHAAVDVGAFPGAGGAEKWEPGRTR